MSKESPSDAKRYAYHFARSGLLGVLLYARRYEISGLLQKHATPAVALCAFGVALAAAMIGGQLHIDALSTVAGMSLLLIPFLWGVGHLLRLQHTARATEHGEGTQAYADALAASRAAADATDGKEDWLFYPPWKDENKPAGTRDPPKFGARRKG